MFLLFFFFLFGAAVSQNICEAPVDLGTTPCPTATPTIRFYFDKTFKRCLPFRYKGCGGNANNFEEMRMCRQRCIPLDNLFCPANTPPTPNQSGSTNCGKHEKEEKCASPEKNFCHHGPNGVGVCCSLDAKKKVDEDRKLVCKSGKKKYAVHKGGKDRVVIGKSCDHQFCPDAYNCEKGNFYSYCCAK